MKTSELKKKLGAMGWSHSHNGTNHAIWHNAIGDTVGIPYSPRLTGRLYKNLLAQAKRADARHAKDRIMAEITTEYVGLNKLVEQTGVDKSSISKAAKTRKASGGWYFDKRKATGDERARAEEIGLDRRANNVWAGSSVPFIDRAQETAQETPGGSNGVRVAAGPGTVAETPRGSSSEIDTLFDEMAEKNERLRTRNTELIGENEALKASNKTLATQAERKDIAATDATANLAQFKADAPDVEMIEYEHSEKVKELNARIEELETKLYAEPAAGAEEVVALAEGLVLAAPEAREALVQNLTRALMLHYKTRQA